jgi:cell division protein FtsI (penicillin-binding protein 3)
MISDREGRPLAVSVPVSAIWIDPQTTMEKGGVGYGPRWQAMAEALHLNLGELAQRVQPSARPFSLSGASDQSRAGGVDR